MWTTLNPNWWQTCKGIRIKLSYNQLKRPPCMFNFVCVCVFTYSPGKATCCLQGKTLLKMQSRSIRTAIYTAITHSVLQIHNWECYLVCWCNLSVFVCAPGNDEGSACAGLDSSSCTDSARGLKARRRGLCQTVDVGINADCAAPPFFSSHVHQDHNIAKLQFSIIGNSQIHLHTRTNTIIIIITFPICIVILLLLVMVPLIRLKSFYRTQHVLLEEVYFLGSKLAPLFFLQKLFLCIL